MKEEEWQRIIVFRSRENEKKVVREKRPKDSEFPEETSSIYSLAVTSDSNGKLMTGKKE